MYRGGRTGSNSLFTASEKAEIMTVVIAVVGSGGKTTRIHQLTEEYRKNNKKVLVTTTTHMYREKGCVLSGNADEIIEKLQEISDAWGDISSNAQDAINIEIAINKISITPVTNLIPSAIFISIFLGMVLLKYSINTLIEKFDFWSAGTTPT